MSNTTPHTFDQQAAALAQAYELTPTDHAWAAIAARLPEERPRRGVWVFPLGLGLVALAIIAGLYFTGRGDFIEVAPSASTISEPIALLDAQSRVFSVATDETIIAPTSSTPTAATSQQSTTTPSPTPRSIASAIPIAEQDETQSVVGKGLAPVSLDGSTRQTATTSLAHVESLRVSSVPTRTSVGPALILSSSSADIKPGHSLSALPALEVVPFASADELDFSLVSIPCADFSNRGYWTLGIRAFAGAGPSGRDLQPTDGPTAYSRLRDSVEVKQLSVHGGLRLEGVHSSGFMVRAGADYSMQRSRLELIGNSGQEFEIVEIRHPVTGNLIRADTVFSTTQTEQLVYNRHQTISLVGGLGYRKTFGAVSPYVLAEAGVEFMIASRGALISTGDQLVDLAETSDAWIAESPGLQYGGVLGVDVAVTDQLELGVSGHYNHRGGLSGSDDPLSDERTALYGALNLRFRFE